MSIRHQLQQFVLSLCILAICASVSTAGRIIYVDGTTGDDTSDGLSWASAKKTMAAGIGTSVSGDQMWVAKGVYIGCITLKEGVALYGGFAGNETQLSQRDIERNVTTIDGNKGQYVVTSTSQTSATKIDGFTIQNGSSGSCVRLSGSSAIVSNNTVTGNVSIWGAIYSTSGSPSITNNKVTGNQSDGIVCPSGQPIIRGNHVTKNTWHGIVCNTSGGQVQENYIADNAGGILCSGGATVTRNRIVNNNASSTTNSNCVAGGGIHCDGGTCKILGNIIIGNVAKENGGGIFCDYQCTAEIANNIISDNTARGGGGIYCYQCQPTITNNTIVGNTADAGSTGGVYGPAGLVANNIIAFNSSGISSANAKNNCVYGNTGYDYYNMSPGPGDISVDPKLVSRSLGEFHLHPSSPCIDAGDSSALQPGWYDIDNQARTYGPKVDIGADEFNGTVWAANPMIVCVTSDGDDSNDGSAWDSAHAKRTIQAAVDAAVTTGGEVWVKAGTYTECVMLRPYVSIYGGFDGTETDKAQRDWSKNQTVIDGDQKGPVISIFGGCLSNTLDGLTIRNGTAANGGGVYCLRSSPIIRNNTLTGNSGGAIYSSGYCSEIVNNRIINNSSSVTAIIYTQGGVIDNNQITGNTGGIQATNARVNNNIIKGNRGNALHVSGDGTVANNVIARNCGHGIVCLGTYVVSNNTVTNNSGSAVPCDLSKPSHLINNILAFNAKGLVATSSSQSAATIANNCVFGNRDGDYEGIEPDATDINTDPLFAAVDYDDVHIQPNSQCVNAGTSEGLPSDLLDMDGQPRVDFISGCVDIGADESDGTAWEVTPRIVRVSPDGNDANDGQAWDAAKRTVKSAISSITATGGEVWVAAGTYREELTLPGYVYLYGGFSGSETSAEQRDWNANVTTLEGLSGKAVITATSIAYCSSVVDGFTICHSQGQSGSGINCNSGSPMISNNTITTNTDSGIRISNSDAVVINNTIRNNSGKDGGGIYGLVGSPRIIGNTVNGNTNSGIRISGSNIVVMNNIIDSNSGTDGAGIYCGLSGVVSNNIITNNYGTGYGGGLNGSGTIANNIIVANSSRYGGGIKTGGGDNKIYNNTIVGNWALDGGGISCAYPAEITNNIVYRNSSGIYDTSLYNRDPQLKNNCVYANTEYDYLDVVAGASDISVDPMLVAAEYGQFHTQPQSPCIDAGDGSIISKIGLSDIDGDARVGGACIDIGADESDGTNWAYTPRVVRVAPDGDDNNDGSSWMEAKRTLQCAIDTAKSEGGEVWAKQGTYSERIKMPSYVYLYGGFTGSEVSRADRPADCISTINGDQLGSVATLKNTGYRLCSLDRFRICNGNASQGGGVSCSYSSPSITRCILENNSASSGGGLYGEYGWISIDQCQLSGNTATYNGGGFQSGTYNRFTLTNSTMDGNSAKTGGAISESSSRSTVTNCVITNNSATTQGGAVYSFGLPSYTNNTVVGNTSPKGGAFSLYSSSASISNNVIAFNSSGIDRSYGSPILRNNCLFENGTSNYTGITPGVGDIALDPLFVNRMEADHRLQTSSPCTNAGWNDAGGIQTFDFAGNPRVQGLAIDMGAYESPWFVPVSTTKSAAENQPVAVCDVIVTAVFADSFYVETQSRSGGVRVDKAGHGCAIGDKINVIGTVSTNADGERYVAATMIETAGTGSVSPLALNISSLGGGTLGYQGGVWNWVLGAGGGELTPASGLNNIGMLVRLSGRIVPYTLVGNTLYVEDGSTAWVKCILPDGVTVDPNWQHVTVTGISSCEKQDGRLHRLIRVRHQEDVTAVH